MGPQSEIIILLFLNNNYKKMHHHFVYNKQAELLKTEALIQ